MKVGHLILVGAALTVFSCAPDTPSENTDSATDVRIWPPLVEQQDTGRWYSQQQVEKGKTLFAQHCAVCHGKNAESKPDWRTPNAFGHYPPPPLNGSAHAWHHPLADLDEVIRAGGRPYGGQMPAWGMVLDADDRLAVIASFQSYWDNKTYRLWAEREALSHSD